MIICSLAYFWSSYHHHDLNHAHRSYSYFGFPQSERKRRKRKKKRTRRKEHKEHDTKRCVYTACIPPFLHSPFAINFSKMESQQPGDPGAKIKHGTTWIRRRRHNDRQHWDIPVAEANPPGCSRKICAMLGWSKTAAPWHVWIV